VLAGFLVLSTTRRGLGTSLHTDLCSWSQIVERAAHAALGENVFLEGESLSEGERADLRASRLGAGSRRPTLANSSTLAKSWPNSSADVVVHFVPEARGRHGRRGRNCA
jgi:hypothetical protein